MRPRLPISLRRSISVLAPAPTPMMQIRPPVASASRFPSRFGAPTSSRITSYSPSATASSGAMALTAPSAPDLPAGLGIADGSGDPRARHHAQLHGRHADAARRAVHEQALADGQPRLGEERVVGGGEHLGDAARRGPVELVRDRHRGALVDDGELGLPASGDHRHHAVAGLEAPDAAAAGDDLARELQARDVGRNTRRRRIVTGNLQDVGTVEPSGADTDQQLAVLGLWSGTIGDLDLAVDDGGGTHVRDDTRRRAVVLGLENG